MVCRALEGYGSPCSVILYTRSLFFSTVCLLASRLDGAKIGFTVIDVNTSSLRSAALVVPGVVHYVSSRSFRYPANSESLC